MSTKRKQNRGGDQKRFQELQVSKVNGKLSNAVRNSKRNHFYKKGKGSVGVFIRRPRLRTVIKQKIVDIRKRQSGLIGAEAGEIRVGSDFLNVMLGALDKYGNNLLQMTQEHAKKPGKNKQGVTLLPSGLEFCDKWYSQISRKE